MEEDLSRRLLLGGLLRRSLVRALLMSAGHLRKHTFRHLTLKSQTVFARSRCTNKWSKEIGTLPMKPWRPWD